MRWVTSMCRSLLSYTGDQKDETESIAILVECFTFFRDHFTELAHGAGEQVEDLKNEWERLLKTISIAENYLSRMSIREQMRRDGAS